MTSGCLDGSGATPSVSRTATNMVINQPHCAWLDRRDGMLCYRLGGLVYKYDTTNKREKKHNRGWVEYDSLEWDNQTQLPPLLWHPLTTYGGTSMEDTVLACSRLISPLLPHRLCSSTAASRKIASRPCYMLWVRSDHPRNDALRARPVAAEIQYMAPRGLAGQHMIVKPTKQNIALALC
jgi:hypothetical protein